MISVMIMRIISVIMGISNVTEHVLGVMPLYVDISQECSNVSPFHR